MSTSKASTSEASTSKASTSKASTSKAKEQRVCVKVGNLRIKYNDKDISLKKWLESPNNVYCGRKGRIFINGERFAYDESKWCNPYTLKQYDRNQCVKLYREYIVNKIKENPNYYNLEELKGKYLGCFCDEHELCHCDILIDLINLN